MIQAIETKYAGCRFRSRLEARWAVFFDALKIRWAYEPEGYKLANGEFYLPDFFLADLNLFVEVKGSEPTAEERSKCMWLADGTGCAVLLVSGLPDENPSDLFCWDLTDSSGGSFQDQATLLWPNGPGSSWGVLTHTDTRVDRDRSLHFDSLFGHLVNAMYVPWGERRDVRSAATEAAKSARFEHGEKGPPR